MPQGIYRKHDMVSYNRGKRQSGSAFIVYEIPFTVYLNDHELVTLVCSPGGYNELAAGFLLSEGLVGEPSDIREITHNEEGGLLQVKTSCPALEVENFLRRQSQNQVASCRGKDTAPLYFINGARYLKAVESEIRFTASDILRLIGLLEENSDSFKLTGGVHSAALADENGLVIMYEDIGRHNAVDRVMGYAFLNRVNTKDKCLLLSGRVSSGILVKATRSGIPVVVSRSAPTSLAVDTASRYNVTLVGFARGERFSVYSHEERIVM